LGDGGTGGGDGGGGEGATTMKVVRTGAVVTVIETPRELDIEVVNEESEAVEATTSAVIVVALDSVTTTTTASVPVQLTTMSSEATPTRAASRDALTLSSVRPVLDCSRRREEASEKAKET
jgi:hypothetical protein